ncbi:hypothetical protein AGOR_G00167590 [Albula goreensis]|uniref:Cadherin-5 n=1 Tax=Albula goreensis TaxID=1534307 RepID=A0A8T3D1N7_9TELE|nr:hypothetical protein AGOR_G00167590 [Albula goreensis]
MGRPGVGQMMLRLGIWAFTLSVAMATAEHMATGPVRLREKREWLWNSLFLEEEKSGQPPFHVGKLKSSKFNANTKFVIEGEGANTIFRVDDNGDISAYEKLDREEKSTYHLTASLIDINTKDPVEEKEKFTIQVTDLNDNSPRFPSNYTGSITERSPQGTEVLKVTATDADDPTTANGQVTYQLLNGTDLFSIKHTGSITTKVNYLDREAQSSYVVMIMAKDMPGMSMGNSATTVVSINVGDINDNMASFKKDLFIFDVRENENANFKVGVMEVEDQDEEQNKDPVFTLKPELCNSAFQVAQNPRRDGVITLKEGLDFETTAKYVCEVQIREPSLVTPPDSNSKQVITKATVYINVLDVDEPPLFTQEVYNFSLREDAAVNFKVGKVSARDPDAAQLQVRYSIDDPSCPVRINPQTGEMHTERELDRELVAKHKFYVTAAEIGSQGLKSYATVNLVVTDVNDNVPELRNVTDIYVCHNEAAGMTVRTIEAFDKDEHPQVFTFKLAKESSNFSLIPTGDNMADIKVKQGGFEADDMREYLLEVIVTDPGKPPRSSTSTVVISMCRCGPDMNKDMCRAYTQTGVSIHALIAILLCILTILVIVILIVLRKRYQKDPMVVLGKNSGEIHEQLVTYDEEGGGEMDTNGYDVSILTSARNELGPRPGPGLYALVKKPSLGHAPIPTPAPATAGRADMAIMIDVKKDEADHDRDGIPYDTLHIYGYEGPESLAGSLSSLATSSEGSNLDYDFLNDWGPRFKTLAELYGVDGMDDDNQY